MAHGAKSGPPSNFNWPVSKTKHIGDHGLHIIFALQAGFTLQDFFELARCRSYYAPGGVTNSTASFQTRTDTEST